MVKTLTEKPKPAGRIKRLEVVRLRRHPALKVVLQDEPFYPLEYYLSYKDDQVRIWFKSTDRRRSKYPLICARVYVSMWNTWKQIETEASKLSKKDQYQQDQIESYWPEFSYLIAQYIGAEI